MGRIFAAFALVVSLVLGAGVRGDDLDIVADRIKVDTYSAAPNATTTNGYLNTLGSDGRWSDVNYADTSQTNWSQQTHLLRLLSMAQSYANPSHSLYQSASLLDGIRKAYDAFVTLDPRSTNWWFNDINTPQLLGKTVLLVQPQLTAAQITSGTAIIARSYIPRSTNAGTNTGTNRMDRAFATILRGSITHDTALTSEAFGAISDTLVKTTDEGIQLDGSFHQHGNQLQGGSYGLTFSSEAADLSVYGVGTTYAMPAESSAVLVDYLLDGQQWMLRGVTYEATGQGRSITRSSSKNLGSGIVGVIDQTMTLTTYRAAELTAMRSRLSAAASSGTASPTLALVGHRHFWSSDYTSHQRPGFSATVKVSSTRTLEPESGNNEGLKNRHLGDGVNLIQQRGDEYTGIQPIWDWRRLPGTTTEQGTYSLKPTADWGVAGSTGFAGGVSDGRNGATVLDYWDLNVKAHKSWFFFDDVEVALGSGVDASAATSPVITTLNQAFQKGSVTWGTTSGSTGTLTSGAQTRSDLSWVLHDGVGYVFPTSQNVTMQAAVQSGAWSDLNTTQASTVVTGSVFSLQVNHGTGPTGGSYAYVVLPGSSGSSVAAYAAAPAVRILSNTRNLQAARHDGMALTQAAFYTSGTLTTGSGATVSVREPSLVMLDESSSAPKLSVSNPYGLATTLHADVTRSRPESADEFTRVTIRLSGSDQGGATVTRTFDQPAVRTFTYQLRDGAAAVAPLVYQWSFEGSTAAERLQNTGTGANATLQAVSYGSEGSTAKIVYGAGLDETTTAMSPQRLGRLSTTAGGALLTTTGTVAIPTSFTVEALVRPDLLETGGSIGYAVMAGGAATNNRGYFLVSQEGTSSDSTATIIGDSVSQADNVGQTVSAFVPGHWYYVANTYTVSGSQTTMSSYVADLTAGQMSVTQAVASQVASGKPLTAAQMALGGYFVSGTAQEAWSGSIDEVSIFGRVLTASEVQSRLDRLHQAPAQVSWSGALTGTSIGGSGTWSSLGLRWVTGTTRLMPVTTSQLVFGGSAGTVAVTGSQAVGAGMTFTTDGYTLTGGTLSFTGTSQAANTVSVLAGGTATLAAAITGSGGMTKTGDGTLLLAGASSLSAPYSITGGRLEVGLAGAVSGTATMVMSPASGTATFDLNGFSQGLASLSTSGSGGVSVIDTTAASGTATLTVGSGNVNETFAGRMQNSVAGGVLAFTKIGTGTMTLTAPDSSIGGPFVVSGGRLVLNPGAAGGFAAAGKFQMTPGSGSNAVIEVLSGSNALAATGIGAIGDSSGTSTFDVKGGTTTIDLSPARLLIGNKGVGVVNVSAGTLVLSGSNDVTLGGDSSYAATNASGTINVTGGTLSVTGSAAFRMGVNITGTTTGAQGTVNLNGGVFETARAFTLGSGSGTINFNGGTLRALASSTNFIAVTAARVGLGGAVIDTGTNTITIAQALVTSGSGAGGLTKVGDGILQLGGINTYTGTTSVTAGVLTISNSAALPGHASAGRYAVANGATLAVTNAVADAAVASIIGTGNLAAGASFGFDTSSGDRTYATGFSGAIGIAKLGTNTLTLSGSQGYTGPTTIAGGTLALASSAGQTLSGVISGIGSLMQSSTFSAGVVTLSGSNTYKGGTTVTSGSLVVQGDQSGATGGWSLPNSATNQLDKSVVFSAGSTVVTGSSGMVQVGNLVASGSNNAVLTVSGSSTNAGALNIGRYGTVTISSGGAWLQSGTMQLSGFGGASATLNVNAGGSFTYTGTSTIKVNPASNNVGKGSVVISGGTFTTGAGFEQVVSSTSTGVPVITLQNGGVLRVSQDVAELAKPLSSGSGIQLSMSLGSGGGTINTNGFTAAVGVAIGGTGGLTKSGGGMLRLMGSNTYSGATVVSGGTLAVFGNQSSATGAVTVASGAALAGTGTVGGATTIQSGATLAPGASPGTLSFTQGLTWANGANYNWQMLNASGTAGTSGGWDLVSVTGTLSIASTAADPFRVNLWSLSSTGPDVNGNALNFSATTSGTWRIATAAGGITGFSADKFQIVTGATNGTGGFTNPLSGGTFSLAQSGNNLNLVFTPGTPASIVINVTSGTQTQTQVGYPLLSGTTPVQKTGLGTAVLDQSNTLTGPTTVSQGTLRLGAAGALVSSTVTVAAGATLSVGPQVQATVPRLVNNGQVDVGLGALTVASGLTAAGVENQIIAGIVNGGTTGITSSNAAPTGGAFTVGWVDNFDGSFTFGYAAGGDTNLDDVVDLTDLLNTVGGGKYDNGLTANWATGDFNYDGVSDLTDLLALVGGGLYDQGDYNTTPRLMLGMTPALSSADPLPGIATVPEPSALMLAAMGLGAVACGWRRRR